MGKNCESFVKAVILAGGRGERIRPISDTLPKALIPLKGKPMLAHQIAQLERIGIQEVLILTGYLSESIRSYCEQIKTSLRITCIQSPPEANPAQRILHSSKEIGNEFLLIYCDNLIVNDSEIKFVINQTSEITFLVQPRELGNIKLISNQKALYRSEERTSDYRYVELGNIAIRSNRFMNYLLKNQDLPKTLEQLSKEMLCTALITNSQVLSTSTFKSYLQSLSSRKLLLLDRDGILIEKMPHREYLSDLKDYKPIYKNWEILKEIANLGTDFIIATNQPGVATGQVSENFLSDFHVKLVSDLINYGINILAVYACKHHWDDNCICRKPKPGLLIEAMRQFEIDPQSTLYIGDELKDSIAANLAGIDHLIVHKEKLSKFSFENLALAIPTIVSKVCKIG